MEIMRGRSTNQIHAQAPRWSLWRSGMANAEAIADVASPANCVIRRALRADGDVALLGHRNSLRILVACWLELPLQSAGLFASILQLLAWSATNAMTV